MQYALPLDRSRMQGKSRPGAGFEVSLGYRQGVLIRILMRNDAGPQHANQQPENRNQRHQTNRSRTSKRKVHGFVHLYTA